MQNLAAAKTMEFHRKFLGEELRVLFETAQAGLTDGLTDNYIRVYTKSPVVPGELYTVKLEKLYKDGLYGQVVAMVK